MKKTSSNPVNNPKDQMRRARRAVIKAVLCGWAGDDPCPFFSPQTRKVILMWAKSHDQRLSNSILEAAFEALVAEGLLKEVHQGTFAEAVYHPTYKAKFLREINADRQQIKNWEGIRRENDREFGPHWKTQGLCWGMGSQSGNSPWGMCVGQACSCFAHGSDACTQGLKFASGLPVHCPGCRRAVLREQLRAHPTGVISRGMTWMVSVCPACISDRSALLNLARREGFDESLTAQKFDEYLANQQEDRHA